MLLWKQAFELDEINSGSWYYCLPIRIRRGRLYEVVLRGSETWPVRREFEVHFSRQSLVRSMCGIKVKDRVSNKKLRQGLETGHNLDITAKQVMMVWTCIG